MLGQRPGVGRGAVAVIALGDDRRALGNVGRAGRQSSEPLCR